MTENNQAQIIEELIRAIAQQDYVETVKLQKNASIEGKTGVHLVDLYWEFSDCGLNYKTLISFKTLNTTATRADLLKLVDMMRDIYGQTTGVLFSRPIYDKDIHVMADNASICICEMMPPLPDTWEPLVGNFQIDADMDFVQQEKKRRNVTEQVNVRSNDPRQLFLYNKNAECIDSIGGIISSYIDKADAANYGKEEINHVFSEETFLQTGHPLLPFVKLLGISFTLEFKLIRQMSDEDKELEMENLVEYILNKISKFTVFQ